MKNKRTKIVVVVIFTVLIALGIYVTTFISGNRSSDAYRGLITTRPVGLDEATLVYFQD